MTTTRVFMPTPSPAVRRWLDRTPTFTTLPALDQRMVGDHDDWADAQRNIGDEIADREGIRRDDDRYYDSFDSDDAA